MTDDEYTVTMVSQETLDKMAETKDAELEAVVAVVVFSDGSMDYYRDGCTSVEALGHLATASQLIIEDNIGKSRGFTFH